MLRPCRSQRRSDLRIMGMTAMSHSGFNATWTMVQFQMTSQKSARRMRRKIRSITGWGSRRICQGTWILIPRSMDRLEKELRPLLPTRDPANKSKEWGSLSMIPVTDKQIENSMNFYPSCIMPFT